MPDLRWLLQSTAFVKLAVVICERTQLLSMSVSNHWEDIRDIPTFQIFENGNDQNNHGGVRGMGQDHFFVFS